MHSNHSHQALVRASSRLPSFEPTLPPMSSDPTTSMNTEGSQDRSPYVHTDLIYVEQSESRTRVTAVNFFARASGTIHL